MPVEDAITLLEKDHAVAKDLLRKLCDAPDAHRRLELLDEVETELKVHSRIEEEVFYPAFKRAVDSKEDRLMYFEAHEEHELVDQLLAACRQVDAGSEHFAAKAKVLKDLVEHHIQEEEEEMFSTAREKIPLTRLRELGSELRDRKDGLMGALEPPRPPSRRPPRRRLRRQAGRLAHKRASAKTRAGEALRRRT